MSAIASADALETSGLPPLPSTPPPPPPSAADDLSLLATAAIDKLRGDQSGHNNPAVEKAVERKTVTFACPPAVEMGSIGPLSVEARVGPAKMGNGVVVKLSALVDNLSSIPVVWRFWLWAMQMLAISWCRSVMMPDHADAPLETSYIRMVTESISNVITWFLMWFVWAAYLNIVAIHIALSITLVNDLHCVSSTFTALQRFIRELPLVKQ